MNEPKGCNPAFFLFLLVLVAGLAWWGYQSQSSGPKTDLPDQLPPVEQQPPAR